MASIRGGIVAEADGVGRQGQLDRDGAQFAGVNDEATAQEPVPLAHATLGVGVGVMGVAQVVVQVHGVPEEGPLADLVH